MSAPKPPAGCRRCCSPRVHFNSGADGDRVGPTTTIVVITLELSGFSLEIARGLAAGVEHLEAARGLFGEVDIHEAEKDASERIFGWYWYATQHSAIFLYPGKPLTCSKVVFSVF